MPPIAAAHRFFVAVVAGTAALAAVPVCNVASQQTQAISTLVARPLQINNDPKAELFVLGLARFGPDGLIYVAENTHKDIRVFDSTGKFIANIGRSGAGPGEFQRVGQFGWTGDTLWVVDPVLRRITLFSRARKLVLTFSTAVVDWPGENLREAVTPFGRFVQVAPEDRSSLQSTPLLRVNRAGKVTDTLASLTFGRLMTRADATFSKTQRTHILMQAFADHETWNTDHGGRFVAITDRSASTSGDPARIRIRLYDLRTHTSKELVVPYQPMPVTSRVLDSVYKLYPPDLAPGALQSLLYLPRFLPPVRLTIVGDDGAVWLERLGADAGTWVRVDATNVITDVVKVPVDYLASDARGRQLLAVRREPDDEHAPIVIYTMVK